MVLELLVSAICAQNAFYESSKDACPTSLQAYYASNQELQETVRIRERQIRQNPYADQFITYVGVPAYTLLVSNRIKISLSSQWSLYTNVPRQTVTIEWALPL